MFWLGASDPSFSAIHVRCGSRCFRWPHGCRAWIASLSYVTGKHALSSFYASVKLSGPDHASGNKVVGSVSKTAEADCMGH